MRFTEFLEEDCIRPFLRARDEAGVLGELAGLLAAKTGVSRERLEALLVERERLASTAVGEGVAIPHCRIEGLTRVTACVGLHPEGVDFHARDGRPVRLFVALVSPPNLVGTHLSLLARIAVLMREERLREALLEADSAAAIREHLERTEEAYMASQHRPDGGLVVGRA